MTAMGRARNSGRGRRDGAATPSVGVRERGPRDRVDTALAATLHDPEGALIGETRRRLPALRRRYRALAVTTSPATAAEMNALLAAANAYAGTPTADSRGPLYRLAIRRALASGAARVHYLDFDRALHWMATAPYELDALLARAAGQRTLLVGRTAGAHRSHHRPLFATETVANRLMALVLGYEGRIDFLVPSFILDSVGAARLLSLSRTRGAAIYGEIPALIASLDDVLSYVECAGLDWETPDRYRREVARLGMAAWRDRMDTPAEWRLRRVMARELLRGFLQVAGRSSRSSVRRLRLSRRRN